MSLLNVKQKEFQGRNIYTGLIPYSVLAINPSREELIKLLNTENINEPNYVSDDKTRLDIWIRNEELGVTNKMSIWMEPKERVSTNGNLLFINEKNQTTWAESLEYIANKATMNWYDTSTARASFVGEDILYDFIVTFINADTSGGGIKLDNIGAIIAGDVTELRKLIDHYSDRQIKLLTGVKDGRVRIYTNYFIKSESRSNKALLNMLEKRPFDAEYTIDEIKEYTLPTHPKKEEQSVSGEKPVASNSLF